MGAFEYSMLQLRAEVQCSRFFLQFVIAADKYLETGKTVRVFRR